MPNPNVPQFNIEVHIHGPLGQGGLEEILGQLDKLTKLVNQIGIVELGIAKTEIQMQQSTTDLISVVQSLVDNSSKVDDAIDKLVEAQNGGDTAAIAQAVTSLQGLKSDQDTHLNKLAVVIPPVVTAPPDTTPVTVPTPDAP
jgi:hypothetical protein